MCMENCSHTCRPSFSNWMTKCTEQAEQQSDHFKTFSLITLLLLLSVIILSLLPSAITPVIVLLPIVLVLITLLIVVIISL